MKTVFNEKKWQDYIHTFDVEEAVKSLDQVLFDAIMHYLESDYGISSNTANDVSNVRMLLEGLRESIIIE